jgi:peroxiredoxin
VADLVRLDHQLDAVNEQVPLEIGARVDTALADVAASGAARGLTVGDRAPLFTLPDARGRDVSLAERLAAGPVVLQFYRGEWCPYCNVHLRALQAALPEIRNRGASLIAISPQSPDHAVSLTEQAELEFDVLSNVDQHVMRDYRVQFTVADELKRVHLDIGVDLGDQNADGSWTLPVPATFVINAQGRIVAAGVEIDYRKRMEPAAILEALDSRDQICRDQ